jgi:hypothetical protein
MLGMTALVVVALLAHGCSTGHGPSARVVFVGWRPGPGQFLTGVIKNVGDSTAYQVTVFTTSCGDHSAGYSNPETLAPGASGWILEGPCGGDAAAGVRPARIDRIEWCRTDDPCGFLR